MNYQYDLKTKTIHNASQNKSHKFITENDMLTHVNQLTFNKILMISQSGKLSSSLTHVHMPLIFAWFMACIAMLSRSCLPLTLIFNCCKKDRCGSIAIACYVGVTTLLQVSIVYLIVHVVSKSCHSNSFVIYGFTWLDTFHQLNFMYMYKV